MDKYCKKCNKETKDCICKYKKFNYGQDEIDFIIEHLKHKNENENKK